MRLLAHIADLLRHIRTRMRFGEYSRAPLGLLRFELEESSAECEWLARANDAWDVDIPLQIRQQNQTLQALHDALNVREAIFASIPEIQTLRVRVYRLGEGSSAELIITGFMSREDEPPPRLSSLVMRAKLAGLHFTLEDGFLTNLTIDKVFEFAD
jgi:hypothetical protein